MCGWQIAFPLFTFTDGVVVLISRPEAGTAVHIYTHLCGFYNCCLLEGEYVVVVQECRRFYIYLGLSMSYLFQTGGVTSVSL
jgi:hypothetical protein